MREALKPDAAEALLRSVVESFWGDRLKVTRETQFEDDIHVGAWSVILPGTELSNVEALKWNKAPEDPFGFVVYLCSEGLVWEFRHPPNLWEHWAQDKVQHTIAQKFETSIDDEGVGEIQADPAGLKDTYFAYMRRNFTNAQMLTDDGQKWFDYVRSQAPKGFQD
jgi:hypothetical protein